MSWIRNPRVEDSFDEMHGISPEIYFENPRQKNTNKAKLIYNGNEIILTEILEKGLTKEATVEYGSEVFTFPVHLDAEKKAVELLRS